jgi:hypothetical protein
VTAVLAELAAWIETQLGDELASRQEIAGTVLARIRVLAAEPSTAVLPDGSGTLSPADLIEVLGALDHAEQLLRERAGAWCDSCVTSLAGACPEHVDDLDQADTYRALAGRLGGAR